MTYHNWRVVKWGVIFDKMSYHGARVKIRSGMVRLLIPCVYTISILESTNFVQCDGSNITDSFKINI